jgi:hypothetical protein
VRLPPPRRGMVRAAILEALVVTGSLAAVGVAIGLLAALGAP